MAPISIPAAGRRDYENVSGTDHDELPLSASTDVDMESMMGEDPLHDEKRSWQRRTRRAAARGDSDDGDELPQKPRGRWARALALWRRYRWLIDTMLLLVNISLSLMLMRNVERELSVSTMQVGGDMTGAGPDFPTRIIKWNADPAFVPNNTVEFFSNKTREQWNTMLPSNSGWGDMDNANDTFFTTTMTHQLHCLFMMGRIYAGLTNNMTDKMMPDYHIHFLHCIDYLRQGVMCSADLAMEPHDPTDPDDLGPGDGSWNGHHVCKDYSHIMPYLEEQISMGVRKVLPIDD